MTRKKQAPRTASSPRIQHKPKALPATAEGVETLPQLVPNGLTPLEQRFAHEYPVDLNATRAYLRANPDVTDGTASVEGCKFLSNPRVRSEIQRLLDERAIRTGITADRVLVRLWQIATADVRKLVEYRIGSCRHCWGMYHQYHYTEAEFSAAQDKHIREEAARARKEKDYEPHPFHEKGGPGYDPNRPPNPECPECWGRGQGMPIIHDTRELDAGEAALFAGLKVTKDGINVVIEDRAAYLQLVGRHLGMWNDKLNVKDETNPLAALLAEIRQQHSTVPIVADDPELATDVASRPVEVRKKLWKAAKT